MRSPRIRRMSAAGFAATTALALSVTACGGSDSQNSSPSGLEKTTLNVGILPVEGSAAVKLSVDRGYFKAEGLTVKIQIIKGGAELPAKLQSGNLDFGVGAYVPFFMAKAGGFPLRLVADAYESSAGTHTILVPKNSPIHTVKDLVGKKIAVNAKRNLATLMIQATVEPQGAKLDDKNFVEMPLPNMQGALKSHAVDAVQAVEPFSSQMQKSGARLVTDLSQGPTATFPVAGYATTENWVRKNPNTLAAFQRAITKAQRQLADRQVLAQILPTYTQIDANTAATMHVGTFPTTINPTRLQRVADTMQQYGYLQKPLDVKSLVSGNSSSG
jgi:NitT/TauT family transport system substrate-binding protein